MNGKNISTLSANLQEAIIIDSQYFCLLRRSVRRHYHHISIAENGITFIKAVQNSNLSSVSR